MLRARRARVVRTRDALEHCHWRRLDLMPRVLAPELLGDRVQARSARFAEARPTSLQAIGIGDGDAVSAEGLASPRDQLAH